jgi:hypothetical protein
MVSVMKANRTHLLYMCAPLGLLDTCRHIPYSYMAFNFLNSSGDGKVHLGQGCTNPGRLANKFCTVAPNICGFSVWKLLDVTLLAKGILRWVVDFLRICAPLT